MIWPRRLILLCTIAMGGLLYLHLVQALAQPAPSLLPASPASEIERWADAVERIGFCLVGFGILAYMMYRQSALEHITKRYDETQQAHLQAFKDINEAYRVMVKETKDTIVLAVQVQTTLVAKLDSMERNYGK